jgi:hypothetical protein
MRRRNLLVVIGLGLACSSDPQMMVGGGADAGPDPDAALGGGLTFTIDWGPVTVPANTEDTRCVVKNLGNPGPAWIAALETHLTASHHLIVYRVPGMEAAMPDPYPCLPFLDTLDPESAGAPLMVSQIEDERLELHYVNYADTEITVDASATFVTLRPEEFQNEADFLFTGNPDIQLPQGVSSLGPTWFPLPDELEDVKIFGMTGHTHKWGTDVEVEHLMAKDGAAQMVYDFENWNWEEPPVARFEPALAMPAGAGFRFTCRWDNQSSGTVNFGESADDEMCFFWSYYYPSQGHKVCVHSDQYDDGEGEPGTDICCPGHPFCALIDDFLNM